jgi:hypothetical protein
MVMKLHEGSQDATHRQRVEARVTRHVRDLFKQLPRLAAFRLSDDLTVADVFGGSTPDNRSMRGLYTVVTQSIVELAECHPEVALLMRGRTFARSLN